MEPPGYYRRFSLTYWVSWHVAHGTRRFFAGLAESWRWGWLQWKKDVSRKPAARPKKDRPLLKLSLACLPIIGLIIIGPPEWFFNHVSILVIAVFLIASGILWGRDKLRAALRRRNMKSSESHARFWKFVAESLAWGVIAVAAMLLMQLRLVAQAFWQGDLAILAVLLLFGAAVAYLRRILQVQSRAAPKIVEAESFVLKRAGIVLANLEEAENSFGPTLALYDWGGTLRAKLAVDQRSLEASLVLCDVSGKQRVRLGEDCIALYDSHETEQLTIGLLDGEPHIALGAGEDGSQRIRLVVEEGDPRITLLDKEETERAILEVTNHSLARVSLFSKEGNRPAIELGADPSGVSTILLSGKNKLQVGCRADGSGENRIIRIFDTSGKVIWSAP